MPGQLPGGQEAADGSLVAPEQVRGLLDRDRAVNLGVIYRGWVCGYSEHSSNVLNPYTVCVRLRLGFDLPEASGAHLSPSTRAREVATDFR